MARSVRRTDGSVRAALVEEYNKLRLDMLKLKAGTIFHADATTAVTADLPSATTTLTAVNRVNAVRTAYILHIASACSASTGQGAHIAADSTNTIGAAATDEASAITLANDIKSKFNTHRASTSYHPTADSTHAISSTDASDAASLYTLVNELYTDVAAHIASGMTSSAINLVAA